MSFTGVSDQEEDGACGQGSCVWGQNYFCWSSPVCQEVQRLHGGAVCQEVISYSGSAARIGWHEGLVTLDSGFTTDGVNPKYMSAWKRSCIKFGFASDSSKSTMRHAMLPYMVAALAARGVCLSTLSIVMVANKFDVLSTRRLDLACKHDMLPEKQSIGPQVALSVQWSTLSFIAYLGLQTGIPR